MDWPTILVKIVGAVLFAVTIRSIVKHVKMQKARAAESKETKQSVSEMALNNILLYLWLAFMIAFSLGMIFNN
jgi:hypothetical protein